MINKTLYHWGMRRKDRVHDVEGNRNGPKKKTTTVGMNSNHQSYIWTQIIIKAKYIVCLN